jgi:hypothetical protein
LKILFTALQLLLCTSAIGQIKSINAFYDSTVVAELYDRIPIGLKLIEDNGQLRQTEGFLAGNYRWNRIRVTTSNGTFQNGYLLIDRQKLAEQAYKVQLEVTVAGATKSFPVTLVLPHVESIRFNHYADSLKRDIHFYLNVEGVFSSGKIYPLDTTAIRFETNVGKIIGQDLLLEGKDNSTKMITVTAIYKNDTAIQAVSSIPVKQLPDPPLKKSN